MSIVAPIKKKFSYRIVLHASHPLQKISHQSTGGRIERTKDSSKNGLVEFNHIYIHMHQGSTLLSIFAHCHSASTVIPLLLKATVKTSIQPNLVLSSTDKSEFMPTCDVAQCKWRACCQMHTEAPGYVRLVQVRLGLVASL